MINFQEKIKKALESIDKEEFIFKTARIEGDECELVIPKAFPKFTQKNKWLRSIIFRKEDFWPVSLSLPKFVNWNENPENFPPPGDLKGCKLVSKIDGSLLSGTIYKGKQILRTRGTFDARSLENGHEIEYLLNKYPKINDYLSDQYSLIFEWVSSINKIVIDYGSEPDLYLIGKIHHQDYSLETQENLDVLGKEMGIKRPEYFYFDTISEMVSAVEKFKDKEGICLYSKKDQEIHKLKAVEYLYRHKFKSNCNLDTLIDLYFEFNCSDYNSFKNKILEKFDHECWILSQGLVSEIADGIKEVEKIVCHMQKFVLELKGLTRKDAALKITEAYGKTNRASFVFNILSNKSLESKDKKKLLYQVLKK